MAMELTKKVQEIVSRASKELGAFALEKVVEASTETAGVVFDAVQGGSLPILTGRKTISEADLKEMRKALAEANAEIEKVRLAQYRYVKVYTAAVALLWNLNHDVMSKKDLRNLEKALKAVDPKCLVD